jgi:hypothetical protein
VKTHLPGLAASLAVLAATLPADFAAGFTGLFVSALRALAEEAGLARTEADDFDFAAIFFCLATALAMTQNNPQRG